MRRVAIRQLLLFATAVFLTACGQRPAAPQAITVTSKSPEAVEHFNAGRELVENAKTPEAAAEFKKAVEIDPEFALAHAYLGVSTPGLEGIAGLDRAITLAGSLPEAERTLIHALLAWVRGEMPKGIALCERLVALSPRDWRAHDLLGRFLHRSARYADATGPLQMATQLNPAAPSSFYLLGHSFLESGRTEQAIEAFREHVRLRPGDASAYDALAEAQMAAGQLQEAEMGFRKALELSPQFFRAWQGVAYTQYFGKNWPAGEKSLGSAIAAAQRPGEKLELGIILAWARLAQGKTAEAMNTLDSIEQGAATDKAAAVHASVPLERAWMLLQTGAAPEGLQQALLAVERIEQSRMAALRPRALATRAFAESRLGRIEDAQKSLTLLEEAVRSEVSPANASGWLHFAQGAVALANGDARAAADHFAQCPDRIAFCRWEQIAAEEKAGDTAAAAATRKYLAGLYRRDPAYLYIHTKF